MAEKSTPSSKSRSSTQIEFIKLRHTWTIENFSFCSEKPGEKLISPIFSIFSAGKNQWNYKSEWRLMLYPKGDDKNGSKFVSVFINLDTSTLKEIQTTYKLGFVNVSGADTNIRDNSATFGKKISTSGYSEFVLQDFLLNEENMILVNDNLTIFCEITVRVVIENNSQTLPTGESDLSKVLQVNKRYKREYDDPIFKESDLSKVLHVNKRYKSEYDDPIFKSTSSTHIKIVNFRHTWIIHNFGRSCKKNREKLISPTFWAGKNRWNDESEWCLWLYPKGRNMESSEYVSLYLMLNTLYAKRQAKFTLGIINADGEVTNKLEGLSWLFRKTGSGYGSPNFINQIDLNNPENQVLVDDKLIIFCEITITLGSESEILINPQSDLSKDLDFLLRNSEFSDITLSAGGKEFPTHKVILAARSPVFRAMFQYDMAETRNNRVEIADLDEEGLSEMLRYMYTGKIHKLKEMAPRLLGMAEKYAMDGLKITCEKVLVDRLSPENAAETLILSDKFRATELKNEVKKFIVAHAAEVGNTSEFESMVRTHPHLGVEAFCLLSNPSIIS